MPLPRSTIRPLIAVDGRTVPIHRKAARRHGCRLRELEMRKLTSKEQQELSRRREGFKAFLAERMPVLADFMQSLELSDPALVLVDAATFLAPLENWMKAQVVQAEDRVWILTRLGYFIGEYLIQRRGGCWFLNELPDSKYFGKYVVGRFARARNSNAMVDPFVVANAYLADRATVKLSAVLGQVEHEIEGSGS